MKILRMLYAIICLLLFVVLAVNFFIWYLIVFAVVPAKKASRVAHSITRAWSWTVHLLFLIPVRVKNKSFIDPNKTYVFISNHRSQLDIPAFLRATGNPFRFLAKAELTKVPVIGFVIRKLYITVDRKDRTDRNKSIEIMRKSLDEGFSVFICPEGTRNRKDDPVVLDFRDGAFRLAIVTQTPLAVLTVMNAADRMSPNRPFEFSPGAIYAEWSEPIDTTGMTVDDVPALKQKVHDIMVSKVLAYRNSRK